MKLQWPDITSKIYHLTPFAIAVHPCLAMELTLLETGM